MPDEMPVVDDGEGPTENRKRLGYRSHVPRKPIGLAGNRVSSEPMLEPGTDMFTLTKEEREAYGIRPDSKVEWVRHPSIWQGVEGIDHAMASKMRGCRVVLRDGHPVSRGTDLVLVEVPREVWEAREKSLTKDTEEWERRVMENDWPDQFHIGDKEELKARLEAEREMIQRTRMAGKGSPTSHLPAFAVEQGLLSKEQAQLMEMEARRGGRVPTPQEREVEARLREAIEKSSRRGNRFYSIPKG